MKSGSMFELPAPGRALAVMIAEWYRAECRVKCRAKRRVLPAAVILIRYLGIHTVRSQLSQFY